MKCILLSPRLADRVCRRWQRPQTPSFCMRCGAFHSPRLDRQADSQAFAHNAASTQPCKAALIAKIAQAEVGCSQAPVLRRTYESRSLVVRAAHKLQLLDLSAIRRPLGLLQGV